MKGNSVHKRSAFAMRDRQKGANQGKSVFCTRVNITGVVEETYSQSLLSVPRFPHFSLYNHFTVLRTTRNPFDELKAFRKLSPLVSDKTGRARITL